MKRSLIWLAIGIVSVHVGRYAGICILAHMGNKELQKELEVYLDHSY